jgi:hypothetical protein
MLCFNEGGNYYNKGKCYVLMNEVIVIIMETVKADYHPLLHENSVVKKNVTLYCIGTSPIKTEYSPLSHGSFKQNVFLYYNMYLAH